MKRTSKSMTEAQVDAVFEKYDKNKDGRLDFEEFKELMSSNSKGVEYMVSFSSRSLKTRKKCICFAQFLYFLREVCLLIKFTITSKKNNCEFHH